jgi:hypothetical protein
MDLLVFVVILILLIIAAAALKLKFKRVDSYPYTKRHTLFSPAERSFFGALDQAVGKEYRVFGKVRVADIIEPRQGLDGSSRQKALNHTSAKHFDFVLCDHGDLSVICAVELDDRSHQARRRQERDAFLEGLCEAVSLPLLRIPAQRAYSVAEVREHVRSAVGVRQQAVPEKLSGEKPQEARMPEPQTSPRTPSCPNCAAPMVRRQAKSGASVGESFWGCSRFPKCRGTLAVDA